MMTRTAVRHYSERWLSFALGHPRERLVALAESVEQRYICGWRTVKGKQRFITEPHEELKLVQKSIRKRLLLPIPLSPIVNSDLPGRSATKNALAHINQPGLASVDIRDCFPRMTNAMVFGVFRGALGLGDNIAQLLTRLTTLRGHLPQGTPTSGALANLILSPVDVELERIAAELGLIVTRYVDNIDFSGLRSREAILPAISVLQAAGFAVRRSKVVNAGYRKPHIATGNLVNGRRIRLPRNKRANVRAAVHEAIQRHALGLPLGLKFTNSLRGRVQHLSTQGHALEADRHRERLAAVGICV